MALDLTDQGARLFAVDRELDERALGLDARERLLERQRVDHQRLRRATMAVNHGRNLFLEARLPCRAFAGLVSCGCTEGYGLCHTFVPFTVVLSSVADQSNNELTRSEERRVGKVWRCGRLTMY